MRALDLTQRDHPNFVFIKPTTQRINRSVAWVAKCKHCGKQQLVGASQIRCGGHTRCIYCQVVKETNYREVTA